MDVKEILDNVETWLNTDTALPHQDFTRAKLLTLLNMAYRQAFKYAMIHSPKEWQQGSVDITWPASQAELELPVGLQSKNILDIRNITSDSVGYQVAVAHGPNYHDVFFKDYKTLQYRTDGWTTAQTLRVTYRIEPERLELESQEPTLIPPYHRDLLVLGTAILARQQVDEGSPPAWQKTYDEYLLAYTKLMSRGRPEARVPGIMITTPSVYYAWSDLR